eukprot:7332968-Prymnesium_polylepis.1
MAVGSCAIHVHNLAPNASLTSHIHAHIHAHAHVHVHVHAHISPQAPTLLASPPQAPRVDPWACWLLANHADGRGEGLLHAAIRGAGIVDA